MCTRLLVLLSVFIATLCTGGVWADGVTVDAARCDVLQVEIENDCLAGGGGSEDCHAVAIAFRDRCRDVEPPPPDCETRCRLHAAEVLERCLAMGLDSTTGPPDPAECEARAEVAFRRCFEECRPPATCQEMCARKATWAHDECLEAGGEPEVCTARAEAALENCLAEQCDRPPPDDCKHRCLRAAAEAKHECLEGDDSEGRCQAVFEEKLRMCLHDCDGEPPPSCEEICTRKARALVEECKEAHPDEHDGCEARGHEFLLHCLEGCEPAPPRPCPERCKRHAVELLEGCVAELGDDPTDEEIAECEAAATAAHEECLATCDRPTCEERCKHRAKRLFNECVMNGGEPDDCRARVEGHLEDCLEHCDDAPPPGCAARCAHAARELLERCLMTDTDPEECQRKARHLLRKCRRHCEVCDPPNCRDRCARLREDILAGCTGDDGTISAECEEEAAIAVRHCHLACDHPHDLPHPDDHLHPHDHPHPQPNDHPTCADRCERRARHHEQSCLDCGGEPERCAARAAAFRERCNAHCDHGPRRPCIRRCKRVARHTLAECLDAGGELEECRSRAGHVLRECASHCPHRPGRCAKRCVHRARHKFSCCLDRSAGAIAACIAEGGEPERCRHEARKRCRRLINGFLVRCLNHCDDVPEPPDPPTCIERCELHVAAVREECDINGGTPDECEAEVVAFLERCREHCDRPDPPHPCDFDCAAAGDRLNTDCVDGGGQDAEDCAARARDFVAHCQDRLDQHCSEEAIELGLGLALADPYQPFVRGDANMDGARDISDPISALDFLFQGGELPCPDAADANDDGELDLSDAIAMLQDVFLGIGPLPEPSSEPGQDPTEDDLSCDNDL